MIFRHSHKAWQIVSVDEQQCSHTSSVRIFLFHRLRLTGMASWHARHKKFLTLFGAGSPQILFQMSSCWDWLTRGARRVDSLGRNFVPDFIEYTPEGLNGHITLSSVGIWLGGILSIKSTSSGWNRPCIRLVSHLLEVGFIRSETLASSNQGQPVIEF